MRTSKSHPLQIAAIETGVGRGKIGVTFAPGKLQASAETGSWSRDLAADLDAIANWRAGLIVTLLEDRELNELSIPTLGDEVRRRGIEWLHLPIRDGCAPGDDFDRAWPRQSETIQSALSKGVNVVVHCKGGIGRAGMIAARLLVELGDRPEVAIARVRRARDPSAVETAEQERWVATGPRGRAKSIRAGRD